jgi:N-acyl-D-amino-acid deacylase
MRVMFPTNVYDDRKALAQTLEQSTPPDGLYFARYAPDPSIVGSTLAEVAKERGKSPVDVYLQLMKAAIDYQVAHPDEDRFESIIGFSMSENDVTRLLAWEHTNICSDGESLGHPRGYGTFPRVLGHYGRDKKVLTLEQAVHKMTGLSAKYLGITDRGIIAPGAHADLVLFDPAIVIDRATLQNPSTLSVGIDKVWVNGRLAYQERRSTGARAGQVLRATKVSP